MLNDWLNKFQNLFTGSGAGGGSAEGADNGRPKREAKNPLGDRGESLAARELQRLGFRIYQRNFKTPMGEIDIIAKDGATLVFVEVKTRAADDPAPEDQVNPDKMHQLTKAAKFYLGRYGDPKPPARFDVIAVVWAANQPPVIRHIKDAFEATF